MQPCWARRRWRGRCLQGEPYIHAFELGGYNIGLDLPIGRELAVGAIGDRRAVFLEVPEAGFVVYERS
jgi:hypothetical protein